MLKEQSNTMAVEHLTVGYEAKAIVNEMNLSLAKNQITTLIGPNGCGKSTLLKAMTRMIPHQKGSVLLEGKSIVKIPTKQLAQKISILSQHQRTPEDITVEELVCYGRMPYQRWYESECVGDREIIQWAMDAVGVLSMKERRVASLSGGERQRAWIAAALAQQPEFLFLDEPTTYLDIGHQLEIMNLVKKLKSELGVGIIMVLHDIEQAMNVSDQIIVMKDGRKIAQGSPADVITSQMLEMVYQVKGEVILLPGREKALIAFDDTIKAIEMEKRNYVR